MQTNEQHDQDPIIKAFQEGHNAVLATGNVYDYQMNLEEGTAIYRPYHAAEYFFNKGYYVLRYSRSGGLTIYREKDIRKRGELNEVLKKTGLNDYVGAKDISPVEAIEVFRGFKVIATTHFDTPFFIVIDYISHLCGHDGSIDERIIAETFNDISCLPLAKKSGNYVLAFDNAENTLSSLLKSMHKVHYGYPSLEESEKFVEQLVKKKEEYAESDISAKEIAKSCRGLQLRQIDSIFKAAKRNGQKVAKQQILEEKKELIERMSEGTLSLIDTTSITLDDLAGMSVVKKIVRKLSNQLASGNKSAPRAILFAGPPGTGKTTLASAMANECGYNCVELSDSIKSKYVGESESNFNKALNVVVEYSPVFLVVDEIDQNFSNRTSMGNDGGVGAHYLKTFFKFASRDDLRGKVVIVGCSNTPQLLDPAMIDRFGVTIPLLEATPNDIVHIFPKIEKRVTGKETLNPESEILKQGAEIIFSKGASPRQIFDIIARTIQVHGTEFTEEDVLESCQHYRGNGDPISTAYSSLSAIKLTGFSDYYPWSDSPEDFTYPWYLEDVVDHKTGEINELELNKKLNEFAKLSRF